MGRSKKLYKVKDVTGGESYYVESSMDDVAKRWRAFQNSEFGEGEFTEEHEPLSIEFIALEEDLRFSVADD